MRKQEFFEVLKQTDRRWVVLPNGSIRARRLRRGGRRDSPLSAVARLVTGKNHDPWGIREVAKTIGLPLQFAECLSYAANYGTSEIRDTLGGTRTVLDYRKQLFELLNLPSKKL